jgi:hypothetical protein
MTFRTFPSTFSCHCVVSPFPITALAFLLSLLPLSNVAGEIIEIYLPELTGNYTIDSASARTATFNLEQPVTEIHQVWIQLAGTITYGTGHGDGIIRPVEPWFDWPGQVYAKMDADEYGYWDTISRPDEGAFEDTVLFETHFENTWDFLLDGTGEVNVCLLAGIFLGGIMVDPPTFELDTVSLLLDVDLETSVDNTTTWGEIKSRYRRTSTAP